MDLSETPGVGKIGAGEYLWTRKLWFGIATTVGAYAQVGTPVPEIDAFSGMAAMGVVGSIAALIWERSRKK